MGIYYDKILGSFVGAAAGDALGAITETYSMDKINEVYGLSLIHISLPSLTRSRVCPSSS